VLLGVRLYLFHFGCGNISRKYTANAHAIAMHLEHDLGRAFAAEGKKPLQNRYDEIHRRVIVVEQQHLEHRWRPGFGTLRLKDGVFTLPVSHTVERFALHASNGVRVPICKCSAPAENPLQTYCVWNAEFFKWLQTMEKPAESEVSGRA
jgi:hypothetical protein